MEGVQDNKEKDGEPGAATAAEEAADTEEGELEASDEEQQEMQVDAADHPPADAAAAAAAGGAAASNCKPVAKPIVEHKGHKKCWIRQQRRINRYIAMYVERTGPVLDPEDPSSWPEGVVWPGDGGKPYVRTWVRLCILDHSGRGLNRQERATKGRTVGKQAGVKIFCTPGHKMARHGFRE